jgi:hypothetical protein
MQHLLRIDPNRSYRVQPIPCHLGLEREHRTPSWFYLCARKTGRINLSVSGLPHTTVQNLIPAVITFAGRKHYGCGEGRSRYHIKHKHNTAALNCVYSQRIEVATTERLPWFTSEASSPDSCAVVNLLAIVAALVLGDNSIFFSGRRVSTNSMLTQLPVTRLVISCWFMSLFCILRVTSSVTLLMFTASRATGFSEVDTDLKIPHSTAYL